MKLCMIGNRGHNGYVFGGLMQRPDIRVVGVSAGTHAPEQSSVQGTADEDDPAPLKAWCDENGHDAAVFEDYRVMLDRVHPELVSVAGPFERHAEMCLECFARRIPVFCEKPVATDLADIARLEAAWRESGVHFAAMMGLRYDPAFYSAWRLVRDGAVGDVRLLSARKSYKFGTRPDYYRYRASYGGTIPWVGSHAIDWIYWFGGRPFVSVSATHTTRANRDYGELEMTAACQFELEDDVLATVTLDYFRPANAPTHGDDRIRVAGTDGVIEVRGGAVFLINADTDGEARMPAVCDRQIFCDFVAQVEGSGVALLTGADTLEVTKACLLARESADQGRIVRWAERSALDSSLCQEKQENTE